MKRTLYEYSTPTAPEALLASIGERVDEYNAAQGDRRVRFALRDCDFEKGIFTLLVREGTTTAGNLDLSVSVSPDASGGSEICGTLAHDPADDKPTFGSRLYGLFLAGFARLTLLALFYGILLGVSYLFPGRNFWIPAIPPAILLIVMIARSILSHRRLPRRIDFFFENFCGARTKRGDR